MNLDTEKPYGYVRGSLLGIRYEQNGHLFDAHGREVDREGNLVGKAPESATQTTNDSGDGQGDGGEQTNPLLELNGEQVRMADLDDDRLREYANNELGFSFTKSKSRPKMEAEILEVLEAGDDSGDGQGDGGEQTGQNDGAAPEGVKSMAQQAAEEKAGAEQ